MSNSKYVFFITGSIAAFKSAQVISQLVKAGHEVRCVATESALKFVGAATFEGLTGHPVLSDLWEPGRAMDHIQLSRWADIGVVCPASANTIAQMALGLAPDVVSSALLAWPKGKPLHVFPAMNTEMLNAEPTQTHLKTLSTRGILVAATGVGDLACGESGAGRLLEPNEVIAQITHQAADSAAMRVRGRQILITGGATREKIDGVRFISNISTGKTAAALCDYFSKNGWDVTYVHGEQAAQPKCHVNEIQFSSVENLDRALHRELGEGNYAAVIHAAAVSDFTVDPINGKISSRTHLNLDLKPTKKILPSLKEYSRNNQLKVIGFKLLLNSTKEDLQAAADKVLKSGADAVVANDLSQLSEDRELHPGFLWAENELREFRTVYEMGNLICEFLTLRESL